MRREGLAFLVKVEYEKHPAYCSHCKVLGHTILQCKRLNYEKTQYVKEIHQTKFQSQHAKSNIDGTKNMKNKKHESEGGLEEHQVQLEKEKFFYSTNAHTTTEFANGNARINKSALLHNSVDLLTAENETTRGLAVTNAHTTPQFDNGNTGIGNSALLHNSFELLSSDSEANHGEADMTIYASTAEQLVDTRMESLDAPLELASNQMGILDVPLILDVPFKAPCSSETRPLNNSVTSVSAPKALDPALVANWAATPVLTPTCFPTPITSNYEFLGMDKRPPTTPYVQIFHSAAANKTIQVLKKFWGDEVDEDNSESDFPNDNTDGSNKYFEENLVKACSSKASKQQKKQKSPRQKKDNSKEGMKTRFKKHVLSHSSA